MLPTILVASLHAVAGSGGSVQVDPGGTIRIQSGGQLVVNQPSTTEMDVWAEFMAALDGAHECSLCDLVNDPCACPGIVCEGDPAAEASSRRSSLTEARAARCAAGCPQA